MLSSSLLLAGFDLPLTVAVLFGIAALSLFLRSLSPLFDRAIMSAEDWGRLEDESLALLRRRDRLVEELQDLEFEAKMNKLGQEDLSDLQRQYREEALALMRTLDQHQEGIEGALKQDLEERSLKREAVRGERQEGQENDRGHKSERQADKAAPGNTEDEVPDALAQADSQEAAEEVGENEQLNAQEEMAGEEAPQASSPRGQDTSGEEESS